MPRAIKIISGRQQQVPGDRSRGRRGNVKERRRRED